MTDALVIVDEPPPTPLALVVAQAQDYARASRSAATKRAYTTAWQDFSAWCEGHDKQALPASGETVALYLADRAGSLKVATLAGRLAAISQAHQTAQHPSPTTSAEVRSVMGGIRRSQGTAPSQKAALLTEDLRGLLATLPDSLLGHRNRALLLLGFAGGFRRSELVALDVTDLTFASEGLVVVVRRSKTDQEGVGRKVGIAYGSQPQTCPVRAVRAWLDAAELREGAVFRPITRHGQLLDSRLADRAVARVVQRTAAAAGLDPSQYGGHSLRAGLATQAAISGVPERVIMAQTGHRSEAMVRRYIRDGSLWRENASTKLGL
jgi:integrase